MRSPGARMCGCCVFNASDFQAHSFCVDASGSANASSVFQLQFSFHPSKTSSFFLFFLTPLSLLSSFLLAAVERIRCSQRTRLGTSRSKCFPAWFSCTSTVRKEASPPFWGGGCCPAPAQTLQCAIVPGASALASILRAILPSRCQTLPNTSQSVFHHIVWTFVKHAGQQKSLRPDATRGHVLHWRIRYITSRARSLVFPCHFFLKCFKFQ